MHECSENQVQSEYTDFRAVYVFSLNGPRQNQELNFVIHNGSGSGLSQFLNFGTYGHTAFRICSSGGVQLATLELTWSTNKVYIVDVKNQSNSLTIELHAYNSGTGTWDTKSISGNYYADSARQANKFYCSGPYNSVHSAFYSPCALYVDPNPNISFNMDVIKNRWRVFST